MLAREAVINDPEVVKLLTNHFVSVPIDNETSASMTQSEKAFLYGFDSGIKACTIGMSAFTADGTKLVTGGDFSPGPVRHMLKQALEAFKPESVVPVKLAPREGVRRAPEGGLILYVTWKTFGNDKPDGGESTGHGLYDKAFNDSLGSDRLWVRKDEAEALAAGKFPESLKARMLRHVKYVMSGPAKDLTLTLRDGRITGTYPIGEGDLQAEILGFVEAKNGVVSRFDLLVKGWGKRLEDHGFAAGLRVVPKGKRIQTVLYFELADPKDGLAKILPSRVLDEQYLR